MPARTGRTLIPVLLALSLVLFASVPAMAQTMSSLPRQKLIVGVVNDPPITMKNEKGQWTGFDVDLWRYIAVDMKLDYELKEMTFKELQNALQTGTIDLSIAALFETAHRHRLFDFSTAIGSTRLAVAVPEGRDPYPWLRVMKIFFSWDMIKTVLVFIALLFALGFILWRIERDLNPDHFDGHPVKGIGTGAYWVSSTLAAGACFDVALKSLPARLIGLLWILLSALAFSAFTASLASTLVSEQQQIQVYNMNKLRGLNLGVLGGTLQHSLARKMGGKYAVFNSEVDALRALKTNKIDGFFIDELPLHYYAAKDTEKRFRIHTTEFKPQRYAFAFPKGSPLRRPLNLALTRIMEKPEWEALASRYGLNTNLEPEHLALGKKSRISN